MVRHYGGLPLAIVVLGGLLATKHKLDEWEMVRRNISYYFPYHVKACFLYWSHLPVDEGIHPEKLDQMWMAVGIVKSLVPAQIGEVDEVTKLDVGMSYLGELVQRCMVQVHLTSFIGRLKLCHLHDLMRDLCLLKAQGENFLKVVHFENFAASSSSSSLSTTICRLAMYYLGDHGIDSSRRGYGNPYPGYGIPNHTHVRSCHFFFFGKFLGHSDCQQIKSLFKGFKLLTVLDLERAGLTYGIEMLPGSIGNLVHLRFSSIRDSAFRGLPSSLGNLGFLQTLDLWADSWSARIPNVPWKLEQLRHLYLPPDTEGPYIGGKLRLDGLSKLETLVGFDTWHFDVRCFPKLMNVQKFEVCVAGLKNLAVSLKSPFFSNSFQLLGYSRRFSNAIGPRMMRNKIAFIY